MSSEAMFYLTGHTCERAEAKYASASGGTILGAMDFTPTSPFIFIFVKLK
jgi:hypothetical protein